MDFDSFLAEVRRRGGPRDRNQAETTSKVVLAALGQRLTGGEPSDFASQLPAELKEAVVSHDADDKIGDDVDDFLRRIAERQGGGSEPEEALTNARAVLGTVASFVSKGQMEHLQAQLPAGFRMLFESAEDSDRHTERRVEDGNPAMQGKETVRVGLVTDPDFPKLVAESVAQRLPEYLSDEWNWEIEVEVDPVTAGKGSTHDILRATRGWLEHHGWNYAICLTDLPVRVDNRPVLAEIDIDLRAGMVSLPALGGSQPYRRTRQVMTQLLDELTHPTEHTASHKRNGRLHGLKSTLTNLLAPIRRVVTNEDNEIDVRYSATKKRGRMRLLSGMVRTNRPWRLIFGLSSALAAAIATSAFGLSSSTIWQISDQLGPLRQVAAAVVSVGVLVFWLIAAHHLWERPSENGPDREQAALYNTSTALTLTVGVGILYIGLFLINLAIAGLLVPGSLLTSMLGRPASLVQYLTLAWGFTTMGMVAGALGSSLETDDAVRQAAYGYREEQRRAEYLSQNQ
jgi:uncharacterized protein (DUF2267 family)